MFVPPKPGPSSNTPAVPDDWICLNGINGVNGHYLVPPFSLATALDRAEGTLPTQSKTGWLRELLDMLLARGSFGLPVGVQVTDLVQAGWAVVFPSTIPAPVRQSLRRLLQRRQQQARQLYKELEYSTGQTRDQWLAQYGAHRSNVLPNRVPYYLLLIGDPEQIPFQFQYELSVSYAVGRLSFEQPEDYEAYANALVEYETDNAVQNTREVVYWGTKHSGDSATKLSADNLVTPLAFGDGEPQVAETFGYRSVPLIAADATKANLLEAILATRSRPALLFTASHGVGWPRGNLHQRPDQGALLCQDWKGFGQMEAEHYLTAKNLEGAAFNGLMAFLFACYGAGTPRYDNFLLDACTGPQEIAEAPFVSALAQRLLTGGALAVIGHIDRAWGFSIRPPVVGPQLLPFKNFVSRILTGEPVGHATIDFSQRYADASVTLANQLNPSTPGARQANDLDLAWAWVERNDAQNFVILGDPAARLRVDGLQSPVTNRRVMTAASRPTTSAPS